MLGVGVLGSLTLAGTSWGLQQTALQDLAQETAEDLIQVSWA